MQKFEKSHTDYILAEFLAYSKDRGFRKKRKDKFIRDAENDLIQCIDVSFGRRHGQLYVTPCLSSMHFGIGKLINEAFAPHRLGENRRQREIDATLNLSPVKSIIARKRGTGATLDYSISSPSEIDASLETVFGDIQSIIDDFFNQQNDLSGLIEHFKTEKRTGGTAHDATLLALYFYTGRHKDLRTYAADLTPDNSSVITISMKNMLLKKLGASIDLPEHPKQEPDPWAASFPVKISRDERRDAKFREKSFMNALKLRAKESDWKFARGVIFKQEGDWFISNFPSLCFKKGAIGRWTYKPMAIDPLFWDIVGLPENNKLTLSFRDSGAWTIRPSWLQTHLSPDETDPEALAEKVIDWSDQWRKVELPTRSLDTMLEDLGPLSSLSGPKRTLAICLLILKENYQQAEELCLTNPADSTAWVIDMGGFGTMARGGEKPQSFYDQARLWLAKKRGTNGDDSTRVAGDITEPSPPPT